MSRQKILLWWVFFLFACNSGGPSYHPGKRFSQSGPVDLDFSTVSAIISDMDQYSSAIKSLDEATYKAVDSRYSGVTFRIRESPLFLNVYPVPEKSQVV